MSGDVTVSKFFDDDLLIELAQADTELAGLF
jgi:U5 small nuclear ribonucleoprotein component